MLEFLGPTVIKGEYAEVRTVDLCQFPLRTQFMDPQIVAQEQGR